MTSKARVKTKILNWYDKNYSDQTQRHELSEGIDAFCHELFDREHWLECKTVFLNCPTPTPAFYLSSRRWRARPSRRGLVVSTILPGWGFGWHQILRSEVAYDVLSWFGHYARQYVHRSYVAKVLMVAWEREQIVLHPFGHQDFARRYDPERPSVSPTAALNTAEKEIYSRYADSNNERTIVRIKSKWMSRNTFDPSIHQAIFHFTRARDLIASGFNLEAVVAFDCAIQSVQKMSWPSKAQGARNSRGDFCRVIGLGTKAKLLVEKTYWIRNQFAAHAGGWRWWDWSDYICDDFVEEASNVTLKSIQRVADLEPTVRRIAPSPDNWALWLIEHFDVMWDTVWFRSGKFSNE